MAELRFPCIGDSNAAQPVAADAPLNALDRPVQHGDLAGSSEVNLMPDNPLQRTCVHQDPDDASRARSGYLMSLRDTNEKALRKFR
jgi:hypothetical protein